VNGSKLRTGAFRRLKAAPRHKAEDQEDDLRGERNSREMKCARIAPRKPVTRIAPRTPVCGTAYKIAQAEAALGVLETKPPWERSERNGGALFLLM
jgi:hypothetical protein